MSAFIRRKAYSQNGEEGVVNDILTRIQKRTPLSRWAVEFGAGDGDENSNTRFWLTYRGYNGVMIEPDHKQFDALDALVSAYPDRLTVVKRAVGITDADGLDAILDNIGRDIPADIDIASIDVDGPDYEIWARIRKYNAKVVIIETDSSVPFGDMTRYVPGTPHAIKGGSTGFSAMCALAKEKNYVPVFYTGNLICVRGDLFPHLGIHQPPLRALYQR